MLEDDDLRTFLRSGHPDDLSDYRRTLERNQGSSTSSEPGSTEAAVRLGASRIEAEAVGRHETLGASVLTDRTLERLSRELSACLARTSPDTALHPSLKRMALMNRMAEKMKAIDAGSYSSADAALLGLDELRSLLDVETSLPWSEKDPPGVLDVVPKAIADEAAELLAAGWNPDAPDGTDDGERERLEAVAARIGWSRVLEDHAYAVAENRIRVRVLTATGGRTRLRNRKTVATLTEAILRLEENGGFGIYAQVWREDGGDVAISPRDARGYLRAWYVRQFHDLSDCVLRDLLSGAPEAAPLFEALGRLDGTLKDDIRRGRSGLAIAAELLLHEEKAMAAREIVARGTADGFRASDLAAVRAVDAAQDPASVADALAAGDTDPEPTEDAPSASDAPEDAADADEDPFADLEAELAAGMERILGGSSAERGS